MDEITVAGIRSWKPCYDPSRYLPEDWSGSALDILRQEQIPPADRLWAVLRQEVLSDRTLRLLACAYMRRTPLEDGRTVWDLLTDPRSRAAVEIAERHARGDATAGELSAAEDAAWDATGAAVAGSAAWAAAWAATLAAARDATEVSFWAAARAAAEKAQVAVTIEIIEAEASVQELEGRDG